MPLTRPSVSSHPSSDEELVVAMAGLQATLAVSSTAGLDVEDVTRLQVDHAACLLFSTRIKFCGHVFMQACVYGYMD
jgi:hypothetical protein